MDGQDYVDIFNGQDLAWVGYKREDRAENKEERKKKKKTESEREREEI